MRELKITVKEDWVDLDLGIESHLLRETQAYVFEVRATRSGSVLGFRLGFPLAWELRQEDGAPIALRYSWVAFATSGGISDQFVSVLADLWHQTKAMKMRDLCELGAVVLKGNPDKILTEEIAMKLFFGNSVNAGAPYGELYLNIDVPRGLVQLHEKDPSYRKAVLHGFSEEFIA